jgi:hypothetical protein
MGLHPEYRIRAAIRLDGYPSIGRTRRMITGGTQADFGLIVPRCRETYAGCWIRTSENAPSRNCLKISGS